MTNVVTPGCLAETVLPPVHPPVCLSVRLFVSPSVCYQVISGTVGPVAAKLCTHTPWMPIQNFFPTLFTLPYYSATREHDDLVEICARKSTASNFSSLKHFTLHFVL